MSGDQSAGPELRIGIIGTDNTHAYPFTAYLNGWSVAEPIPAHLPNGTPVADMHLWAMHLRRVADDESVDVPISGARVTALWGADRREAALLGRACGIDRLCAEPQDVCADVDAVMVLSERPETHLTYARFALERGLPTYVDKPFAESLDTAREIFAVAERNGAPCYTGSAVRWSGELLAARDHALARWGRPRAVYVPCPLGVELYGIHAVEMVNLFLGHDVAVVRAMEGAGREVVLLEYRDGASAVFEHLAFRRWPVYSATLYGDTWDHRIALTELAETLLAVVQQFVEVARGGPVPAPADESLRLVEIVAAASEALRTGEPVRLAHGDAMAAAAS